MYVFTTGRSNRPLIPLLVAALLASLIVTIGAQLATPDSASASHGRAAQLTWHVHGGDPLEVEFHFNTAWRSGFFGNPAVGDTVGLGNFDFGDGTSTFISATVTGVDAPNDVILTSWSETHTYANAGPFTASHSNCCRLSSFDGHQNNGDGNYQFETVVDLSTTTDSPESLTSPIVDCPQNAVCTFFVQAVDADSAPSPLSYRFATAAEASGPFGAFVQPAGATIDPATGLYTFDTTGLPDGFYSTQVMISDGAASVPVDFFIRITDSVSNQAPVFIAPTPADGSIIEVTLGDPADLTIAAQDADVGDTVTTNIIGLPAGASFTPTPGNPGSGDLVWTPTALGQTVLVLQAADQSGLQAVQRSITIRVVPVVATNQPPVFDGPTPADGAVIDVNVGDPVSIALQATDPDSGDVVTLSAAAPVPATVSTTDGNPATGTFDWTPTVAGAVVVQLDAVDQDGASAVPRSFTINVKNVVPPPPGNVCDTATYVVTNSDWDNKKLARRGQTTVKAPIGLPDGTYDITLVSQDLDHAPGVQTDQTSERWLVEVFEVRASRSDRRFYSSPLIDDLPEADQLLTQVVDTDVMINRGGDYMVVAKHKGQRGTNSIRPLCVVFTPTATP